MNTSRPFLLGVLALGWLTGLASSQPALDMGPPAPLVKLPDPVVAAQPAPVLAQPNRASYDPDPDLEGYIGGVGLYLLQPYFASNLAYTTMRTTGVRTAPGFTRKDDRTEIDHNLAVAPQVWLGYLCDDGWGGRVRYWYLRQGTGQTVEGADTQGQAGATVTSFFAAAPLGLQVMAFVNQQLNVTSKLELHVLDLEGLREFQAGGCNFLVSAGLRLARIDQTYNAFLTTEGRTIDAVLSGHKFDGIGPVVAGEIHCPLGGCGLALYGSARGAVLFGESRQNAVLISQSSAGSDSRDRSMLVGEMELGLEYRQVVSGWELFGQVALVGQNWFGAGGASRATPEVVPGGGFAPGSFVQDSDIGFLGAAFRLGVSY